VSSTRFPRSDDYMETNRRSHWQNCALNHLRGNRRAVDRMLAISDEFCQLPSREMQRAHVKTHRPCKRIMITVIRVLLPAGPSARVRENTARAAATVKRCLQQQTYCHLLCQTRRPVSGPPIDETPLQGHFPFNRLTVIRLRSDMILQYVDKRELILRY
jgi:hypothetical protein